MKSILLTAALLYIAIAGGMFFAQRAFLYFPDREFPEQLNADNIDSGFVRVNTSDGLTLIGWYHPAKAGQKTILYFHGNGGNIGHRLPFMQPYIDAGYGVLMAEYRGYGGNPGKPTEKGLYKDARAYLSFLTQHRKISPRDIVLYGESLGSAIAVDVAAENPDLSTMLLITPLPGIVPVAKEKYWYLPVSFLVRDRYDSLSKVGGLTIPSYYFIAGQDAVVPAHFADMLFDAVGGKKERFYFPHAGHNDLSQYGLSEKILEVLNAL